MCVWPLFIGTITHSFFVHFHTYTDVDVPVPLQWPVQLLCALAWFLITLWAITGVVHCDALCGFWSNGRGFPNQMIRASVLGDDAYDAAEEFEDVDESDDE